MEKIRVGSLFSGIGGFDLGLIQTGKYEIVWSCDNNEFANKIYRRHFPNHEHYSSDIRGVNPEEIPDFDLLCAGFPCPSFSIAKKGRGGFTETKGTLFFEICRIAETKQPSMLLLENVKGLLNHDRGRTFAVILNSLEGLGYWWEYQVLDSQHYGVAQRRKRVFIIGHLRGTSSKPIFPILKDDGEFDETQEETSGERPRVWVANTVSARYYKGGENVIAIPHAVHRGYSYGEDKIRFYNNISPTITTPSGGGHLPEIYDGYRYRKFTEKEVERLQGFPDNWTKKGSYTKRTTVLGNAVTVNVIKFLGERIYNSCR